MNDRAPVVDFNKPYDPLDGMLAQRQRLRNAIEDIERSMADVQRYGAEGARYAGYAAAWGATLMLADIVKLGMSTANPQAKILFDAQDLALERANKLLDLIGMGMGTIATKDDLIKTVDPNLEGAFKLTQFVTSSQNVLAKLGVKIPKEWALLLNLATTMCDDTVFMINAGQAQQSVTGNVSHARAAMLQNLLKVKQRLKMVDGEIERVYQERSTPRRMP